MLWAISVLLLLLWFLGLIGGMGGVLTWAPLLIAAVLMLFQLLGKRRVA